MDIGINPGGWGYIPSGCNLWTQRVSEIQALSVAKNHLRFGSNAVHLLPRAGFLGKNQSLDFTPKPIILPDLRRASASEDCAPWCPVRSLKFYIAKCKSYRGEIDSLFLTVNKPIRKASKQTISKRIISVIKDTHGHLPPSK